MALDQAALDILRARIIREILEEGSTVNANEVDRRVQEFLESENLDSPSFSSSNFEVTRRDNSSASLYNQTNRFIEDDLAVLYRNMFLVGNESMRSLDRWRAQFSNLETQLNSLEDRVSNLLLITQDTEGYFNFVSDVFADTSKINLVDSSVVVDLGREQISIGPNDSGATRQSLNLLEPSNVEFIVLTRQNLQSAIQAEDAGAINAFKDNSKFWQHRVHMNNPDPVVAELRVHVSDEPVTISRIGMKLHSANSNSSVKITPLVSTDGVNYSQLSTAGFEQSVIHKATFTFPPTEVTHVKFIMAKDGFDHIDGLLYVYEFGADEIALYSEGFKEDTSNVFISKALSVTDTNDNVAKFNRCTLSVCELVPNETTIDYSVAANSEIPSSVDDLNFVPIDPLDRQAPINPTVIDFTDLSNFEVGNTTTSGLQVHVSYDATNSNSLLVNPGPTFDLIDIDSNNNLTETPVTVSGLRYPIPDNSNRILNHQISADIEFEDNAITVFRNLGLQGDTTIVRGVQAGWGFEEPYYSTTIEIKNNAGKVVDFGDNEIIIDGVVRKGEITIPQGIHIVQVHESNWVSVTSGANSEDDLEDIDPLYPHNHKLLIEGYPYPSNFDGDQIYTGVDLFAEHRLQRVSPFDMFRSVQAGDYTKYAVDLDAPEGASDPSRVIIVKANANNPDSTNERFVIRMNVNTSTLSFNYIWLKAVLKTSNPEVAPIFDSYMIKLGR